MSRKNYYNSDDYEERKLQEELDKAIRKQSFFTLKRKKNDLLNNNLNNDSLPIRQEKREYRQPPQQAWQIDDKENKRRTRFSPIEFESYYIKYIIIAALSILLIILAVVFRKQITELLATILGWAIILLIVTLIIKYIIHQIKKHF